MLNKLLVVIVLSVFAAGCGVKAESYVMTKDRVDQDQNGNGGALIGKPDANTHPVKKTRKVYVLEVTKPLAEGKADKVEDVQVASTKEPQQEVAEVKTQAAEVQVPRAKRAVVVSSVEDAAPAKVEAAIVPQQGPTEDQQYTVLKDDTLQKIAKKIYGSYSKWIKIYDANKAKIKDPNLVKPGTVLTLPAVDSGKKN